MSSNTFAFLVVAFNLRTKQIDSTVGLVYQNTRQEAARAALLTVAEDQFKPSDGWENHQSAVCLVQGLSVTQKANPHLHVYGIRAYQDYGQGVVNLKVAITYEISEGPDPVDMERLKEYMRSRFPEEDHWKVVVGCISKPIYLSLVGPSSLN